MYGKVEGIFSINRANFKKFSENLYLHFHNKQEKINFNGWEDKSIVSVSVIVNVALLSKKVNFSKKVLVKKMNK